jgi:RNA polymerase sigma-70 factor, ECF subfamily
MRRFSDERVRHVSATREGSTMCISAKDAALVTGDSSGIRAVYKDQLVAEMSNLRAFAISLCGSLSLADDLVQETVLRAWSKSDKFQPGTKFRAWLITILRNIYYSNYRRRRREVQDTNGAYSRRIVVSGDQESHLDLEDFRRALARLPSEQREALILVGANGLSYEEAATICEIEIGTVKSRVSRARSKLVELLAVDETVEPQVRHKRVACAPGAATRSSGRAAVSASIA